MSAALNARNSKKEGKKIYINHRKKDSSNWVLSNFRARKLRPLKKGVFTAHRES